ncbi:hypothetical protein [Shewanella woodyi]|uniref:hypothetical protein n=1 Tax=Shewanella woodyi TaxID=60961 RepID=UPI0007F96BBF|nr:hypothetical protein [Shewanella woodyi]
MDDKGIDTDSIVTELMSSKVADKCNNMLEEPDDSSGSPLDDKTLLKKDQSVDGNSNIVAHGNIVIASSLPGQSDVKAGQRNADEHINFSESIELKKLVTQITELEALLESDQESWIIWKRLSDHCNVSNDSGNTPRYQLIPSKEFYKAKCFLIEWYCRLIELFNQRLKSENEAFKVSNVELFSLRNELEKERQIRDSFASEIQKIEQAKNDVIEEKAHILRESKQHERALYFLISVLMMSTVILGLGWYGLV